MSLNDQQAHCRRRQRKRQRRAVGNGNGRAARAARCWSAAAAWPASRPRWTSRRPAIRVYLVEESPTIGGSMARLDKTFPTGDCATCIISPKLVECMRDYNIDVLTMADVTRLEGEAGPFQGRGAQAAAQRRCQQVHRLRRLLDGLPGAQTCRRRPPPFQPSEPLRGRRRRQARRDPRPARRRCRAR